MADKFQFFLDLSDRTIFVHGTTRQFRDGGNHHMNAIGSQSPRIKLSNISYLEPYF